MIEVITCLSPWSCPQAPWWFAQCGLLRKRGLRQLDDWTVAFEAEEERRKQEAADTAAGDGWTVVARKVVRSHFGLRLGVLQSARS